MFKRILPTRSILHKFQKQFQHFKYPFIPKSDKYHSTTIRNTHHHYSTAHGKQCSSTAVINKISAKSPTILSLADLISYSSNIHRMHEFALFIFNELPIRISHRITDLSSLPYGLSNTTSIKQLRDLYIHSFHILRSLPSPDTIEKEEQFIKEIAVHFDHLQNAAHLIANGLAECIAQNPNQRESIEACPYLNQFLDRFHGARIGTRMITGHFIAARAYFNKIKSAQIGFENGNKKRVTGLIDFYCNPKSIIEIAADDASYICESNFGKCPEVNIIFKDNDTRFTYIPSHLHYVFFELLKNSMRAVCDSISMGDLPPIEVVIVASKESEDVIVKISDQGGGISRDNIAKIWYYSFSTVNSKPVVDLNGNKLMINDGSSPMAGFGYGLPLSRLYARYFGGDLEVISMDGYGTDAYVYLNWLKEDDEHLLQRPETNNNYN